MPGDFNHNQCRLTATSTHLHHPVVLLAACQLQQLPDDLQLLEGISSSSATSTWGSCDVIHCCLTARQQGGHFISQLTYRQTDSSSNEITGQRGHSVLAWSRLSQLLIQNRVFQDLVSCC